MVETTETCDTFTDSGKGKDIEKLAGSRDTHISISQKSIEISHKGEPVKGATTTGYVYLLVDRSASMEGNKLKQAKNGALNFAKDALAKDYYTGLIQFDSSANLKSTKGLLSELV